MCEAEIQEEPIVGWVRSIFRYTWKTWVQVPALHICILSPWESSDFLFVKWGGGISLSLKTVLQCYEVRRSPSQLWPQTGLLETVIIVIYPSVPWNYSCEQHEIISCHEACIQRRGAIRHINEQLIWDTDNCYEQCGGEWLCIGGADPVGKTGSSLRR